MDAVKRANEPPHRIELSDKELASGPLPKELELSEEEKAEALAQYAAPLELPQEIQNANNRDTDPLLKISKRKGTK